MDDKRGEKKRRGGRGREDVKPESKVEKEMTVTGVVEGNRRNEKCERK